MVWRPLTFTVMMAILIYRDTLLPSTIGVDEERTNETLME